MSKYHAAFVVNLKTEEAKRARINEIALKWARIAREKAKEDCSTQQAVQPTVPIGAPWTRS